MADSELYDRGTATLVADWEECARAATGAEVLRAPGVAIAAFRCEPERSFYNNALLDRDLDTIQRSDAIDALEATYGTASIASFAAWVHESDAALRADLEHRGYTVTETTRAMGMTLDEIRLPRPEIDFAPAHWLDHLRVLHLSSELLGHGDHAAFHILVGRLDGADVATAMAFDWQGDCGIGNVGTVEHARRRGLATALTLAHLHEAVRRGCQTASLQSTPMAERVYAGVGFRDLGRILEYTRKAEWWM
jgi:hypothetical protein